jgi:hypothetical protein
MTNNNEISEEDWANWVPIPMEPVELRNAEIDNCNAKNIPLRSMRVKKEDGNEYLMIFKRIELPARGDDNKII